MINIQKSYSYILYSVAHLEDTRTIFLLNTSYLKNFQMIFFPVDEQITTKFYLV